MELTLGSVGVRGAVYWYAAHGAGLGTPFCTASVPCRTFHAPCSTYTLRPPPLLQVADGFLLLVLDPAALTAKVRRGVGGGGGWWVRVGEKQGGGD